MRRFVPLLLVSVLFGCAPRASLVRLDPSERAPTGPERVQVLAAAPEQPYRVIARWEVQGGGAGEAHEEKLAQAAVEQAARLGADAVVLSFQRGLDVQMEAAEPGAQVSSRTHRSTRLEAEMLVWERQ